MGKAIEEIALKQGHFIACKINLGDDLNQLIDMNVDVAIEFTQPDSAFGNIAFCLQQNIPIITGTTGWADRLKEIEELCKSQNGTFLSASNFSIGVNLFFELNEWLAKRMNTLDFTPSIREVHHTEKKDSPSGTAITLAEGLISKIDRTEGWINEKSTDHKKLGIVSERIPNVPGTHTVTYTSLLETVEIQHTAHDRAVFAQGAVKVAEWILNKKGVFTMSDFINDN